MKRCIILANGLPPKKKDFNFIVKLGYVKLICADGGANSAAKLDLIPDYIIGDFDSILPEVYDYFIDKSEIIHIKRQNDTDVEKCIKFAIKEKFEEVMLMAVTGDRLDHTLCNMGIVYKYFKMISIKMLHQKSLLFACTGDITIKTVINETISIYGIDSKTYFTSKGLKYPLKNISLPFGKKESTSNVAIANSVELKIKSGVGFIIRDFEIMMKNGLF
jgi:thiamine pyrophosphokinase